MKTSKYYKMTFLLTYIHFTFSFTDVIDKKTENNISIYYFENVDPFGKNHTYIFQNQWKANTEPQTRIQVQ